MLNQQSEGKPAEFFNFIGAKMKKSKNPKARKYKAKLPRLQIRAKLHRSLNRQKCLTSKIEGKLGEFFNLSMNRNRERKLPEQKEDHSRSPQYLS